MQLFYVCSAGIKMVTVGRVERPTYCLGGSRSIHLSYTVTADILP